MFYVFIVKEQLQSVYFTSNQYGKTFHEQFKSIQGKVGSEFLTCIFTVMRNKLCFAAMLQHMVNFDGTELPVNSPMPQNIQLAEPIKRNVIPYFYPKY